MSRASYIYMVKKDPSRHVLGAYTVKYEALKGISLYADTERLSVWRYVDGGGNTLPSLMAEGTAKEILEKLR